MADRSPATYARLIRERRHYRQPGPSALRLCLPASPALTAAEGQGRRPAGWQRRPAARRPRPPAPLTCGARCRRRRRGAAPACPQKTRPEVVYSLHGVAAPRKFTLRAGWPVKARASADLPTPARPRSSVAGGAATSMLCRSESFRSARTGLRAAREVVQVHPRGPAGGNGFRGVPFQGAGQWHRLRRQSAGGTCK